MKFARRKADQDRDDLIRKAVEEGHTEEAVADAIGLPLEVINVILANE